MKGIILAGGLGTRLMPLTKAKNKHTFLIYDKPMIFYPLSILMLMNIKNILIISDKKAIIDFKNLLGNGKGFGIKISYEIQNKPKGIVDAFRVGKNFIKASKRNVLVLGDNLFYGSELQTVFPNILNKNQGCSIFLCPVKNPYAFGNVVFDKQNKIKDIKEKMKSNNNDLAVTGLYFFDEKVIDYAKKISYSRRGELEITDLLKSYLKKDNLSYKILSRGFLWYDMGTIESINEVNNIVENIQNRQRTAIGNVHEIAYLKKFISRSKLRLLLRKYNSPYFNYLKEKYL